MTAALKTAFSAHPWFNDNKDALTLKNGQAWKGTTLYVPITLRLQVLQCSHDAKLAGHFGYLKTLYLAR